jgi:hypothetical protein
MRFLLSIFLLFLCSCKTCKEGREDELCSDLQWNESNALRLDGYYYREYSDPPRREIFFLYKNGVMMNGGLVNLDELTAVEASYANGIYYLENSGFISRWGQYKIENEHFSFEKWYPSTNNWIAYIKDGIVVNDTTFHIVTSSTCDVSDFNIRDETYHFKKFGPKPDSTNQYIP